MFNIFKSGFKPDYLGTAKQKLRDLIALHLKTLAMQRYAGITVDAYGNVDGSKWNAEAQYFLDKLLLPRLSNEERQAVLTAGLSAIGQEFIETPVRDECSRMHAAGEHDMTVRRLHPPDSKLKTTEAPPRRALVGASLTGMITRGLIVRKEPLDRILSGAKTWEMRSGLTKVRGTVALIQKGSKAVSVWRTSSTREARFHGPRCLRQSTTTGLLQIASTIPTSRNIASPGCSKTCVAFRNRSTINTKGA